MLLRSQQKLISGPIEGYKIVNNDMTCSPCGNIFKFKMGRNVLPNDAPLELCKNGFHFCPQPSGVWSYYQRGRVFKVRAYDVLDIPVEPGADFKMVCAEIEFIEEIKIGGNWNTGDRNAGNGNAGDRNTGNWNTGDRNAGNWNTGNWNTGNWNTGDRNAGNWNTGNRNTGDRNAGNGNTGNYHSGNLNYGEAPFYMFNKKCKISRNEIDWYKVNRLSELLQKDDPIDPEPFLDLPNASKTAIKKLHEAHISARKNKL